MSQLSSKLVLALIILFTSLAFGQGDLEVFGFFQGQLSKVNGDYKISADVPTQSGIQNMVFREINDDYLNSNVQQMNLFARKEITEDFTAMVNLEFTNSFSSERRWGNLNLEEAWLSYQYNDYLKVKAGLLIPKFNNLNEIKNKSPLLPYILRPMIYEASYSGLVPIREFIPERAFLQVYGNFSASDLTFDYAAYVGHSETPYVRADTSDGPKVPGTDTTNFKLVGGRFGVNYGDLRIGVSATYDKANRAVVYGEDVPRTRLGADLAYTLADFFIDAEYISVKLNPEMDTPNLDKMFYYATLGYNVTDEFFTYGTYSYCEDNETDYLKTGMKTYFIGAGYKPDYAISIKAQYGMFKADGVITNPMIPVPADVKLDYSNYSLAISVLF